MSIQFVFPENIHLGTNSLVEAWLEIRWALEQDSTSQWQIDPEFDIVVGEFYRRVKAKYGSRKSLEATKIPEVLTPYVVRYQFRNGEEGWPLLQLGPGVASVNFAQPYVWSTFYEEALYLREQLTHSYERPLVTQALALRYRNAIPFSFSSGDLFGFLREDLNITIGRPPAIPGGAGVSERLNDLSIVMTFSLRDQVGTGTLRLGVGKARLRDTAGQTRPEEEAVVFELEVASDQNNVPSLYEIAAFGQWLGIAHRVIHDWYFSLIQGRIRDRFERGK